MSTEGEDRLIKAVCMMVVRYTTKNLPESRRGIHAPTLDDGLIHGKVLDALNRIVADLTEDIMVKVRRTPSVDVLLPDGRTTVLDNGLACTVAAGAPHGKCGHVSRCAAVTRMAGEVVHVECENHAPEFK